jgi:hypothetical protein
VLFDKQHELKPIDYRLRRNLWVALAAVIAFALMIGLLLWFATLDLRL